MWPTISVDWERARSCHHGGPTLVLNNWSGTWILQDEQMYRLFTCIMFWSLHPLLYYILFPETYFRIYSFFKCKARSLWGAGLCYGLVDGKCLSPTRLFWGGFSSFKWMDSLTVQSNQWTALTPRHRILWLIMMWPCRRRRSNEWN